MATNPHLIIFFAVLLVLIMPYCAVGGNVLYSGDTLYAGESLVEGIYLFIIQNDCNLVLYDTGNPVWSSKTDGWGSNCRLTMQSDGNLVVYTSYGKAVWASNTARHEGKYYVILQLDRNVVIYGGPIWATHTNRFPRETINENVTQQHPLNVSQDSFRTRQTRVCHAD